MPDRLTERVAQPAHSSSRRVRWSGNAGRPARRGARLPVLAPASGCATGRAAGVAGPAGPEGLPGTAGAVEADDAGPAAGTRGFGSAICEDHEGAAADAVDGGWAGGGPARPAAADAPRPHVLLQPAGGLCGPASGSTSSSGSVSVGRRSERPNGSRRACERDRSARRGRSIGRETRLSASVPPSGIELPAIAGPSTSRSFIRSVATSFGSRPPFAPPDTLEERPDAARKSKLCHGSASSVANPVQIVWVERARDSFPAVRWKVAIERGDAQERLIREARIPPNWPCPMDDPIDEENR